MSTRTFSRNAFETQLDGGINNSVQTFPVDSSTGLTDPVYMCIDPKSPTKREYIRVGNISGTTWSSVTRGLAGSAAGATDHLTGVIVRAVPTHQHLEDIFDDIEALETADSGHFGGTDIGDHPEATGSVRGFLSAADKTKLDTVATGAIKDHGDADGLSDDDHSLYLTVGRHDSDDHSALVERVYFSALSNFATTTSPAERWYAPFNLDIVRVTISLKIVSSSGSVIVDAHRNGTTIFATGGNRPSISAASFFAASGDPDGTSTMTKDTDYIEILVDANGTGAEGLTTCIEFVRT